MLRGFFLLAAIGGPFCVLGATDYFYVAGDGVHVKRFFNFMESHYDWSDISEIQVSCETQRNALALAFTLRMNDGKSVDLLRDARDTFVQNYDRIRLCLQAQPRIPYRRHLTDEGVALLKRLHQTDSEIILRLLQEDIWSTN